MKPLLYMYEVANSLLKSKFLDRYHYKMLCCDLQLSMEKILGAVFDGLLKVIDIEYDLPEGHRRFHEFA